MVDVCPIKCVVRFKQVPVQVHYKQVPVLVNKSKYARGKLMFMFYVCTASVMDMDDCCSVFEPVCPASVAMHVDDCSDSGPNSVSTNDK